MYQTYGGCFFFFQAEDGIRDLVRSRGLGDVYKRQQMGFFITEPNYGDYLIQLRKDRKRSTTEVIDDIRHRFEVSQPALRIDFGQVIGCLLYTSPSPRDRTRSRMPPSA